MKENGRLCNFGLFELFGSAGEHNVSDRKTENLIGFFEHLLGFGYVVVQVFAHADELGTLTGEYKCIHCYFVLRLKFLMQQFLCSFRGKSML